LGKNEKEQADAIKQAKKKEPAQKEPETVKKAEETSTAEEEKKPEKTVEEDLREQLEKANEELKKQKDLLLRTAAEYDNFRKRTEREKLALYADATSAAVTEFLPVADNLTRALEQKDCSAEDLRKGVEMVLTQMEAALKKLDVTEMGKEGEPFNPDLHNAVSHIEDENAGENTITQVFQKGYKIQDKVIRHAMVQVAN
jgi:Molecular chaperone GrpE (heat shock protein)